jgi:Sulfotransferase family
VRRYLFIIGAQRSGTTLLAEGLDRHPEVQFARPLRPEPKYLLGSDAEIGAEDYEARFFEGLPDEVMRAEKSTTYIERPEVAGRMAQHFPGSRCIALLRDPVERAVSNYWLSVLHGFETRPPEVALDPAAETDELVVGVSASPFAYLKRGRYLASLDAFSDVLGKDRLLVLQTERLLNGAGDWEQVHASLELKPARAPSSRERVNAAPRPQPVAESTLDRLAAYFAPHNAALADTYPIDVSLWRKPA